ncbi:MAG: class I SAM-dependent methyltransferase [Halanaerobiales bacterium]
MNSNIKQWLQEIAIDSLSQLGIKPGMKVLDFGAREGYYTLPLAKIVSSQGEVIAVDEDKKALNNLKKKMVEESIDNVKIINNKGKADLDIQDNSLDFIILFDVFHELKDSDNHLKEFQRILKNKATKL